MAQPVYSTLFVAATAVNVDARYTVPDGHIAVVRDVNFFFNGTPNNTAAQAYDLTTASYIAYHLMVNPFENFHWEGRQVLDAGATLQGASSGPNGCSIRISGYLLTLP